MSAEGNISNKIRSILHQVNSTVISIGNHDGHFISTAQLAVLEECADDLDKFESTVGVNTPTTSEAAQDCTEEGAVRVRRAEVAREIKRKELLLATSGKSAKPTINLELGKLYSERAKLDRLIKVFDAQAIAASK